MHICFASLDYPDETGGGGVGFYVRIIGHELVRKGHRVSVVALKKTKDPPDRTDDQGIKVYWVNSGVIHWYVSKLPVIGNLFALPIRQLEYSKAICNAIIEIDRLDHIDIVEGIETGAYYFSELRPDLKKIIRLHGEAYTFLKYTPPGHIPLSVRLSRYLQKKPLLHVDQLTSPSKVHAEEIKSELSREDITIKIIPNPLEIEKVTGIKTARDHKHPLFLYVGRIQKVKGIIPLLKAIPKVLSKVPEASFIFAGHFHPSIPEKKLNVLINGLGIGKHVKFLGHVGHEQLKSLYYEATAAVLPSYYESFGYTFLEACVYGLPVVAFDIAPARNFIKNGKNGFLVPIDDINALANACLRSINMRLLAPSENEYALYSPERVCEKMIGVYNEVLVSFMLREKWLNIYLSPHFDDAVFSCAGMIYEQTRQGQDTAIITIFGGKPDYSRMSPFAQEIHKKWKVADPISMRRNEDKQAIKILDAQQLHFDFLDCIYRQSRDNHFVYNYYEDLTGPIHPDDNYLLKNIYNRLIGIIQNFDHEHVRIFAPLGIGNHVDHQIVSRVGMKLLSEGFKVFFYEEIPYSFWSPDALKDFLTKNENEWSSKIVTIDISAKLKALKPYDSQFSGLGGSFKKAAKRFKKYAASVGNGNFAERVWTIDKN